MEDSSDILGLSFKRDICKLVFVFPLFRQIANTN